MPTHTRSRAQQHLEFPLVANSGCTSNKTQRASALFNAHAVSMRQLPRSFHSSHYNCIKQPSIQHSHCFVTLLAEHTGPSKSKTPHALMLGSDSHMIEAQPQTTQPLHYEFGSRPQISQQRTTPMAPIIGMAHQSAPLHLHVYIHTRPVVPNDAQAQQSQSCLFQAVLQP